MIYGGDGLMRIIHCADIHLESPMNTRFTDKVAKERKSEILAGFIEMVRYAAANGVEAIIIAGDLFDKEKVAKKISDAMINVIENNREIDFYYLRGNHDKGRWIESLNYVPDNLLLFNESFISYIANDKRKGNIVITGIEKKGTDTALYDELELDGNDFNIVVMHGNLLESNVEYREEDISIRRLAGKNIDYLAMGHLHSYSEGKLDSRGSFCYSGCLMARGFDECGEHGFVLIDIDENTLNVSRRFVKMSGREVYIKYVDVSGCSDNNEAEEKVKRVLDEDGVSSKSIVRVILCGKAEHGCDVDADILKGWLDKEYYYIEVTDELKRIDEYEADEEYEDISRTSTLKGEFIRIVKKRKDITSEDKQAIIRYGLIALDGEDIRDED